MLQLRRKRLGDCACQCSERQRRAPTLAQGNALGLLAKRIQALKGVLMHPPIAVRIGTPFQGLPQL
jgi:hypothetical protein